MSIEKIANDLIEKRLSIDQVFLLSLIAHKDSSLLDKYIDGVKIDDLVLQDLHVRGFISLIEKEKGYVGDNIVLNYYEPYEISDVLKTVTDTNQNYYDDCWTELTSIYPKKSGKRPLHNDVKKAKKKYTQLLKKGTDHEDVIKGLTNEIEARKYHLATGKFFPEWKLLTTYINQESWIPFINMEEENTISDEDELL